jgi:pyruvate dehydrogenase E2 component (dihydrolipoamide acetyltransferase)
MRKIVARRLTEAKQTVPHFYLSVDIQLDALLKLRADLNARSKPDTPTAFKLSVNDLLIKSAALALREIPGVNASFTDAGIAYYDDGGFSISNLGMFGISPFAAIINPPQGAILAVGAGEQRAVVRHDALAIATMMTCTMSVDHRVVDGALGAQWLQAFKSIVEDPLGILL